MAHLFTLYSNSSVTSLVEPASVIAFFVDILGCRGCGRRAVRR